MEYEDCESINDSAYASKNNLDNFSAYNILLQKLSLVSEKSKQKNSTRH